MADIADTANDTAQVCTDEALRRARKNAGPEHDESFDGLHCVDCCDEIHRARLALGKVRCVECQSELEKRTAMRGHNRGVE